MSSSLPFPKDSVEEGSKREFGFFAVVVIAILAATQSVDPGVMNIALASVSEDLGIQGFGLSMTASVGTLTLAATVIAVGAFADRIGVRKVIMIGLVFEIVGNLIVAFTPDFTILLVGRVIAGLGMGALFAGAFSMVPEIAGKKGVAKVIGQWTGMLYVLLIIFSVIGSVLIGINWRLGFVLVPVICLIMLFVVPAALPETARRGAKEFDTLGLCTLGLGMVLVLLGVSFAAVSLTSPLFWGTILVGLILLGLWAVIEGKSRKASFPIGLFKSPVFVAAVLAGILWNFGESAMQLQSANFWQKVVDVPAGVVGISQMPFLIAAVIAGFLGGALLAKGRSPVIVMSLGFLMMILGMLSVSFTSVETTVVSFMPALILVGGGMVLVAVVQAREYVAEAPAKYLSAVVSSRTSVGQLGYSLGVALTSTIITIGITKDDGSVSKDPAAYAEAFNTAMLVTAGILLVGGIVAGILLAIGLKRRPNAAAVEDPEMLPDPVN
ncbi:MAG: MFS transporter [Actinobacteria bacterium]|nr:MFS transporter [Actinomycetota bacterium]